MSKSQRDREQEEQLDRASRLEAIFQAVEDERRGKKKETAIEEQEELLSVMEKNEKSTNKPKEGPPWTFAFRAGTHEQAKARLEEKAKELEGKGAGQVLKTKIRFRRRNTDGDIETFYTCHYRWEEGAPKGGKREKRSEKKRKGRKAA